MCSRWLRGKSDKTRFVTCLNELALKTLDKKRPSVTKPSPSERGPSLRFCQLSVFPSNSGTQRAVFCIAVWTFLHNLQKNWSPQIRSSDPPKKRYRVMATVIERIFQTLGGIAYSTGRIICKYQNCTSLIWGRYFRDLISQWGKTH